MRYPWRTAKHKTFIAYFPDKVSILDVVDVVYGELLTLNPAADIRFSVEPFVDLCNVDVRVGDVEYEKVEPKFIEDLRFHFLHLPTPSNPELCSGNQSCEGKFTKSSKAALLLALNRFGGRLLVRTPNSTERKETTFKTTDYVHERSAFFDSIAKVSEFMPLYGACEVVKAARSLEKRRRLLDVMASIADHSISG
jgi:hypothetical protein